MRTKLIFKRVPTVASGDSPEVLRALEFLSMASEADRLKLEAIADSRVRMFLDAMEQAADAGSNTKVKAKRILLGKFRENLLAQYGPAVNSLTLFTILRGNSQSKVAAKLFSDEELVKLLRDPSGEEVIQFDFNILGETEKDLISTVLEGGYPKLAADLRSKKAKQASVTPAVVEPVSTAAMMPAVAAESASVVEAIPAAAGAGIAAASLPLPPTPAEAFAEVLVIYEPLLASTSATEEAKAKVRDSEGHILRILNSVPGRDFSTLCATLDLESPAIGAGHFRVLRKMLQSEKEFFSPEEFVTRSLKPNKRDMTWFGRYLIFIALYYDKVKSYDAKKPESQLRLVRGFVSEFYSALMLHPAESRVSILNKELSFLKELKESGESLVGFAAFILKIGLEHLHQDTKEIDSLLSKYGLSKKDEFEKLALNFLLTKKEPPSLEATAKITATSAQLPESMPTPIALAAKPLPAAPAIGVGAAGEMTREERMGAALAAAIAANKEIEKLMKKGDKKSLLKLLKRNLIKESKAHSPRDPIQASLALFMLLDAIAAQEAQQRRSLISEADVMTLLEDPELRDVQFDFWLQSAHTQCDLILSAASKSYFSLSHYLILKEQQQLEASDWDFLEVYFKAQKYTMSPLRETLWLIQDLGEKLVKPGAKERGSSPLASLRLRVANIFSALRKYPEKYDVLLSQEIEAIANGGLDKISCIYALRALSECTDSEKIKERINILCEAVAAAAAEAATAGAGVAVAATAIPAPAPTPASTLAPTTSALFPAAPAAGACEEIFELYRLHFESPTDPDIENKIKAKLTLLSPADYSKVEIIVDEEFDLAACAIRAGHTTVLKMLLIQEKRAYGDKFITQSREMGPAWRTWFSKWLLLIELSYQKNRGGKLEDVSALLQGLTREFYSALRMHPTESRSGILEYEFKLLKVLSWKQASCACWALRLCFQYLNKDTREMDTHRLFKKDPALDKYALNIGIVDVVERTYLKIELAKIVLSKNKEALQAFVKRFPEEPMTRIFVETLMLRIKAVDSENIHFLLNALGRKQIRWFLDYRAEADSLALVDLIIGGIHSEDRTNYSSVVEKLSGDALNSKVDKDLEELRQILDFILDRAFLNVNDQVNYFINRFKNDSYAIVFNNFNAILLAQAGLFYEAQGRFVPTKKKLLLSDVAGSQEFKYLRAFYDANYEGFCREIDKSVSTACGDSEFNINRFCERFRRGYLFFNLYEPGDGFSKSEKEETRFAIAIMRDMFNYLLNQIMKSHKDSPLAKALIQSLSRVDDLDPKLKSRIEKSCGIVISKALLAVTAVEAVAGPESGPKSEPESKEANEVAQAASLTEASSRKIDLSLVIDTENVAELIEFLSDLSGTRLECLVKEIKSRIEKGQIQSFDFALRYISQKNGQDLINYEDSGDISRTFLFYLLSHASLDQCKKLHPESDAAMAEIDLGVLQSFISLLIVTIHESIDQQVERLFSEVLGERPKSDPERVRVEANLYALFLASMQVFKELNNTLGISEENERASVIRLLLKCEADTSFDANNFAECFWRGYCYYSMANPGNLEPYRWILDTVTQNPKKHGRVHEALLKCLTDNEFASLEQAEILLLKESFIEPRKAPKKKKPAAKSAIADLGCVAEGSTLASVSAPATAPAPATIAIAAQASAAALSSPAHAPAAKKDAVKFAPPLLSPQQLAMEEFKNAQKTLFKFLSLWKATLDKTKASEFELSKRIEERQEHLREVGKALRGESKSTKNSIPDDKTASSLPSSYTNAHYMALAARVHESCANIPGEYKLPELLHKVAILQIPVVEEVEFGELAEVASAAATISVEAAAPAPVLASESAAALAPERISHAPLVDPDPVPAPTTSPAPTRTETPDGSSGDSDFRTASSASDSISSSDPDIFSELVPSNPALAPEASSAVALVAVAPVEDFRLIPAAAGAGAGAAGVAVTAPIPTPVPTLLPSLAPIPAPTPLHVILPDDMPIVTKLRELLMNGLGGKFKRLVLQGSQLYLSYPLDIDSLGDTLESIPEAELEAFKDKLVAMLEANGFRVLNKKSAKKPIIVPGGARRLSIEIAAEGDGSGYGLINHMSIDLIVRTNPLDNKAQNYTSLSSSYYDPETKVVTHECNGDRYIEESIKARVFSIRAREMKNTDRFELKADASNLKILYRAWGEAYSGKMLLDKSAVHLISKIMECGGDLRGLKARDQDSAALANALSELVVSHFIHYQSIENYEHRTLILRAFLSSLGLVDLRAFKLKAMAQIILNDFENFKVGDARLNHFDEFMAFCSTRYSASYSTGAWGSDEMILAAKQKALAHHLFFYKSPKDDPYYLDKIMLLMAGSSSEQRATLMQGAMKLALTKYTKRYQNDSERKKVSGPLKALLLSAVRLRVMNGVLLNVLDQMINESIQALNFVNDEASLKQAKALLIMCKDLDCPKKLSGLLLGLCYSMSYDEFFKETEELLHLCRHLPTQPQFSVVVLRALAQRHFDAYSSSSFKDSDYFSRAQALLSLCKNYNISLLAQRELGASLNLLDLNKAVTALELFKRPPESLLRPPAVVIPNAAFYKDHKEIVVLPALSPAAALAPAFFMSTFPLPAARAGAGAMPVFLPPQPPLPLTPPPPLPPGGAGFFQHYGCGEEVGVARGTGLSAAADPYVPPLPAAIQAQRHRGYYAEKRRADKEAAAHPPARGAGASGR